MTTPPQPPPDDAEPWPYPQQPPPPQGYPAYPPPQYPVYPPGYPPPRRNNDGGIVIGFVFVGITVSVVLNILVMIAALSIVGADSNVGNDGTQFLWISGVLSVVVAFGGGGGLIAFKKPWTKGMGIGLMIGWALMSILVGFCVSILQGSLG
ncbi:hypothetical protein [Antrihabitans stalactiti]|uniref:hypothetical protein n=1 Tax=Antrihabitans stalactiti TaxID=2584121 RepID=UPI00197EADCC|nr:hypothetical protein [Antrihabitans stalactiti]